MLEEKTSTPPTTAEILAILKGHRSHSVVMTRPQKLQLHGNRLYWLQGNPLALYSVDTANPADTARNVLDAQERSGTMSKEEELLRQRQRNSLQGITSFRVVTPERIFFEANGKLYYCCNGCVTDVLANAGFDGVAVDIQPSPVDPYTAAFTSACNIFTITVTVDDVGAVVGCRLTQLTQSGKEKLQFGVADYIIQEEFDRYTGYCWSPDASSILFTITDTSMLKEVTMVDRNNELETMPFPKVGDPNATTSLAVIHIASGAIRCISLGMLTSMFPWCEYVPRLGWVAAAATPTIYVAALDRPQEKIVVAAVAVNAIPLVAQEEDLLAEDTSGLQLPFVTLFHDERRSTWIDVGQTLVPVAGDGLVLLARNSLEAGGFRHIAFTHAYGCDPDKVSWLTTGLWNVKDGTLSYHEATNRLYFLANSEEDPLLQDLCSIGMPPASSGTISPVEVQRHTRNVHMESFAVLADGSGFALVGHNGTDIPHIEILSMRSDGTGSVTMNLGTDWLKISNRAQFDADCVAPETITFPTHDGAPMSAHVFLPPQAALPGAKVPLLMYVYGGPHAQLIFRNSFYCRSNALYNTLRKLGVAVAVVDGRMSEANGQSVHKACKFSMGKFETADYVAAAKHLAERYPVVDRSRVGIFGWSYGGYSTLLAMAEAPHVFKLGVAGAPVGDWRLYDTGYTERYMGLLSETRGRIAYETSTVGSRAAGFPDDLNRLIIGHGITDENVHVSHTWSVLKQLTEAGKPYQLLAYPGERHGMGSTARNHFDSMLCRAALQYL